MGPSGVGKSTLLHIVGTLDEPSAGIREISGYNALGDQRAFLRNQHIGFVFQNYNLLDEYSVLENVLMPSRIGRGGNREESARQLLAQVGLEDHLHHLAKQLSGGEKQRAAIARALCNNPDLILADEPSGNLDDTNSARIHDILISTAKSLKKGLIVVTHNHALAKQCDFIYNLHNGVLELVESSHD
jgi:lipoprotein-releasing system ATP-binding protein